MPRVPASRRTFAIAAAIVAALLLAQAPPAGARKLQMSGTWAIRNGSVFLPLQFGLTQPAATMLMSSMGYLSKAAFSPNGPIPGAGAVSATGSAPATLVIPRHRFVMNAAAAIPFVGVTLVQLTTMFAIDGPFEEVVLAPGGGPGSFTWCPNDVLGCPATGLPNRGDRHGRIIYREGANRFGGSMRIGLANGGVYSFLFDQDPFQLGHVPFGASGPTPHVPAVGSGAPSLTAKQRHYLAPGVVTQPLIPPTPSGLVLYPGPKVTTMFGVTTSGSGPTFRLPSLGPSPMGMPAGQFTSSYGFGHTTGTVIVQMTAYGPNHSFFTLMGSDARTPLGAGNIATVAGGVSFRNTLAGQTPYTSWHKVWMTLGPPVPSLSPAGLAAASALMLLAVGYALRRRVGGRAPDA